MFLERWMLLGSLVLAKLQLHPSFEATFHADSPPPLARSGEGP